MHHIINPKTYHNLDNNISNIDHIHNINKINKINHINNAIWNQIKCQSQPSSNLPSKRWGHKTITIENEIILFGGFSDTSYLNDMWVYNIYTNRWKKITTQGQRPQKKSNFTMNYNPIDNSIIIFGGGGLMKKRYNTINILDWQTKLWKQYTFQNKPAPWERTYHTAEFKYPYLFVFGGEGLANINFDDLWVFNVQNKQWKCIEVNQEIQSIAKDNNNNSNNSNNNNSNNNNNNNNQSRIQSRRFHCSALINNQLFIISGCKANYQCLPNIYSINLLPLFAANGYHNNTNNKNNSINRNKKNSLNNTCDESQKLHWKQYILSGKQISLIQRWGHTVQVYQDKIYIFGGRNKDDLNDILVFDPFKVQLKKVQISINSHLNNPINSNTFNTTINTTLFNTHHHKNLSNIPKSRRRHSSCMIGSSMIIFGGFNVQYFNDMHYISLFTLKQSLHKLNSINYTYQQQNNKQPEQNQIITLSYESYQHFKTETLKSKVEYNIQLVFINHNNKLYKIGSVQQQLIRQSKYFKTLLQFHHTNKSNKFKKEVQLILPQNVSLQAMIILNNFMIKGILILKQQQNVYSELSVLAMLLQCSDYYIVDKLKSHIQKILINKVISVSKTNQKNMNSQLINIIYSIGGYYHLQQLLSLCSSLLILTQSHSLHQYTHNYKYNYHKNINNYNKNSPKILDYILVNNRSNLIKTKEIQKLLIQTQFDQLQRSKQYRSKHKQINYRQNIKQYNIIKMNQLEQNSSCKDKQNKRGSILNKVINSINKIYQKQNHINQSKQNIINHTHNHNHTNPNSNSNYKLSVNRLQFNNISNFDINS